MGDDGIELVFGVIYLLTYAKSVVFLKNGFDVFHNDVSLLIYAISNTLKRLFEHLL